MSIKPVESILVIDDDDVFRRRLARAFIDRGYNVFEASCSIDAHKILNTKTIHKIILDLKLGEESGLNLLREIVKLSDALILVLTGYGTIATTVDAMRLGAVNYLTKPVNADAVLAAFEKDIVSPVATPHLTQVEWDHIQRVMHDHGGNISKASKALGLHRRSLQRKLSKNPNKLK